MLLQGLLHDMNPAWSDVAARRALRFRGRRTMVQPVLDHLLRSDRRAAVLVGPRQVGKTTLLHQVMDGLLDGKLTPQNLTYFDFSDDRLPARGISAREVVEYAATGLRADQPRVFLFDEISRAPRWSQWLKQAVDSGEGRIVVTDSAATLLRRGTQESGLGRWDEYRIETLAWPEFLALLAGSPTPIAGADARGEVEARFPDAFERYLSVGGWPEHVGADSLVEARRRIRVDTVDRAIRRDLIRFDVDVERIRELFAYLVADSGAIFDAAARRRLLDRPGAEPVDPRTLEKWVALLEETMLIARLDPFARAATGALRGRARPKLYAADHGLCVAFGRVSDPLDDPRIRGQVFEAAVFRHLREWCGAHDAQLSYLRDAAGTEEVDFVLHRGQHVLALIEVTANRDPTKKAGDLESIGRRTKSPRTVVVHGGLEQRMAAGVSLAPLHEFLSSPSEWLEGP